MTHENPYEEAITTTEEFETALGNLLLAAISNDINPRGTWTYRNSDGEPDWEAMVVELEKSD